MEEEGGWGGRAHACMIGSASRLPAAGAPRRVTSRPGRGERHPAATVVGFSTTSAGLGGSITHCSLDVPVISIRQWGYWFKEHHGGHLRGLPILLNLWRAPRDHAPSGSIRGSWPTLRVGSSGAGWGAPHKDAQLPGRKPLAQTTAPLGTLSVSQRAGVPGADGPRGSPTVMNG